MHIILYKYVCTIVYMYLYVGESVYTLYEGTHMLPEQADVNTHQHSSHCSKRTSVSVHLSVCTLYIITSCGGRLYCMYLLTGWYFVELKMVVYVLVRVYILIR